MAYIFLDESGQFSKDGDNEYFVIASFTVADPRRSYNGFRAWMRSKMPRVMRDQPEVKFAETRIDDKLRLRTLKAITALGVRIRYTYLHKRNIPDEFRYKGTLRDGHLYAHIVAETIESYLPTLDRELRIFCDERHLKGITRKEFKQNLEGHLLPLMPPGSLVQVDMAVSHENPNIQIADWIAGALSWYHNGRPLGQECYLALRNSLLGEGKELFKDQWLPK